MIKKIKKNAEIISILFFFSIFTLFFNVAQAEKAEKNLSPVGLWRTVDDKTKQTSSFIRIWLDKNELKGRIEKTFAKPNEKERCDKCKGSLHNQPILGMTIIYGMHDSGKVWKG